MIVKKTLYWLGLVMFTCLLGGCNLFIDDEAADGEETQGFKNVPEHEGEGYDEAVTVHDGDVEVTYRFKKNVRHLDDEDLKYITFVKHDKTGALMEIHYAGNTPKDRLPVPGEILVSSNTDTFEWGCNHLVQNRSDVDGEHRYLLTFATLDDTFEELNINGNLSSAEYEHYSVSEVPLDENGEPIESPSPVAATRGADKGSFDVDWNDDSFWVSIPLGFEFPPLEFNNGVEAKLSTEGSYVKCTTTFNFDDFSLKNMKFKVIQDVEQVLNIQLSGGVEGQKRLKRWKPIEGKAFMVGPVVLVLFVNIDFFLEGSMLATFSAEKEQHVIYTYNVDYRTNKCEKEKTEVTSKDWVLSASVEGSVGLRLAFQLGMGIYGKVLSVRFAPSLYAGLEATLPLVSSKKSDGTNTYDIRDGLGVTFKVLIDLTLGAYIDLSLSAIIGDKAARSVKEFGAQMDKLIDLANGDSEVYKQLAESTPTDDLNDVMNNANKEEAWTTKLASWTVYKYQLPWFPKMKDKSFKIKKTWDNYKKKMAFVGEYKIAKEGFFAALGTKYVPALRIMDGSTLITTLFPDEGGMDAIVKKGSTYHFTLGATADEVTYTAIPCYFSRPISAYEPDALDKGLPFSATSPMISITDVRLDKCNVEYSEWGGYGRDKTYEYDYQFHVDTYTSIVGMANIYDWGLKELMSKTETNRDRSDKDEDGTYVMHWTFHQYSHTGGDKALKLDYEPYFTIKLSDKKGDRQTVWGSHFKINVFSNGDFSFNFAREDEAAEAGARTYGGDGDEVEVVLDGISPP